MDAKFTLSELNNQIKDALVGAFPTSVWVVAEISELKENRSGHCYLELVEKKGNNIVARSRATIWSYTFRILKPYFETTTGQIFNAGIKILVQVSVEYHPSFGLSLNVRDIDPTYTIGDLALQRKEIIDRLKAEGVFDMNKEIELPVVPQKIAVISSETAAGYQDFINQLENNEFGFKFYTKLFQASMQGAETVSSIIYALERIFEYEDFFDAVVIIRGGGATADLSSFDNYELAVNVSQFPLPVLTGIGHEKDDTVIDLVAHTRLKTPTAVAEFLISGMAGFYQALIDIEHEIVQITRENIEAKNEKLEQIAENISAHVSDFIVRKQFQLNKTGNQLQQNVAAFSFQKKHELNSVKYHFNSAISVWQVQTKNRINQKKRQLKRVLNEQILKQEAQMVHFKDLLVNQTKTFLFKEMERLHFNKNAVRLLNPENVLKRGYTLTLKEGKIVKSVAQLSVNEEITTQFADGSVKSKINSKE